MVSVITREVQHVVAGAILVGHGDVYDRDHPLGIPKTQKIQEAERQPGRYQKEAPFHEGHTHPIGAMKGGRRRLTVAVAVADGNYNRPRPSAAIAGLR